jgi:hypothetical protein
MEQDECRSITWEIADIEAAVVAWHAMFRERR